MLLYFLLWVEREQFSFWVCRTRQNFQGECSPRHIPRNVGIITGNRDEGSVPDFYNFASAKRANVCWALSTLRGLGS